MLVTDDFSFGHLEVGVLSLMCSLTNMFSYYCLFLYPLRLVPRGALTFTGGRSLCGALTFIGGRSPRGALTFTGGRSQKGAPLFNRVFHTYIYAATV